MSKSIIFNFQIWIGYGVHEKVSDKIRIAKFPYPYTTALQLELLGFGPITLPGHRCSQNRRAGEDSCQSLHLMPVVKRNF